MGLAHHVYVVYCDCSIFPLSPSPCAFPLTTPTPTHQPASKPQPPSPPQKNKQAAFLMRRIVLPILHERDAVSFQAPSQPPSQQQQQQQQQQRQQRQPPSQHPRRAMATAPPQNALGWPVFDREGRLMAVVVAVNHYHTGRWEQEQEQEEQDDDDDGRRDAVRGTRGAGVAGRYAAFGPEEERMMVNLCSQVRRV
jgi:hypothetical protein